MGLAGLPTSFTPQTFTFIVLKSKLTLKSCLLLRPTSAYMSYSYALTIIAFVRLGWSLILNVHFIRP